MNSEAKDFYERYWKGSQTDSTFNEVPVWGNLEDLNNLFVFFKEGIKGKILDAGCGMGDWVFHLAQFKQVTEVIGIDISETVIKECVKRSKEKKLQNKTKFVVGSVSDLSFKNNTFDTIFSLEVVEHILDVDKMFGEFNRLLKKGGYLGISTVDFNLLKQIIISLFFFEKYFDPRSPHIRFFTKKTLTNMLEKNGFKIVNYKWTKSYFGVMPMGQLMFAQKVRDI